MDSRLLNVIYDDPFDGNYANYSNETDFWSSGSDTMGLQLTETLHGILPIAPTEDFHKESNSSLNIQNLNKNLFNYQDFAEEHITTNDDNIESVAIDVTLDGIGIKEEREQNENDDDDILTAYDQCSNETFRTRTDSSSIGDYESHTSDYDDEVVNDFDDSNGKLEISEKCILQSSIDDSPLENFNQFANLPVNFGKTRTVSNNSVVSDVDGLDLNIDANNFDLAEFITKDDIAINATLAPLITKESDSPDINCLQSSIQVISSKQVESDSDSDFIVDIETVEGDENVELKPIPDLVNSRLDTEFINEDDNAYVDNVVADPSWSPPHNGKKSEIPAKEVKCGPQKHSGQGLNKKNGEKQKEKSCESKCKATQKSTKVLTKKLNKPTTNHQTNGKTCENTNSLVGVGKGGKNLALIKHERDSIAEQKSLDKNGSNRDPRKTLQAAVTSEQKSPEKPFKNGIQHLQSVKRKLNIEEYKRRREEPQSSKNSMDKDNASDMHNKAIKLEKTNEKDKGSQIHGSLTTLTSHSEEVTSIVKSLKGNQTVSVTDPITEAKKKVLRMQELKRAQQLRIIDSAISAKVPKVTKLLPLREIVKDTPYLVEEAPKELNANESYKTHPEYEEIIIDSVGCNTDISIPPLSKSNTMTVSNASRSLLKSSTLLSTISNTFQKVKASDYVRISTNSLITSIQDVVVKKSFPIENGDSVKRQCKNSGLKNAAKPTYHGEDRIIMHLRKDRIRKSTSTIGVQTHLQPEFPPLLLLRSNRKQKSRGRLGKQGKPNYRKTQYRSSSASSSTSEHSSPSERSHSSKSSELSRANSCRSRDESYSSSVERTRTYDSAVGTGGYSSRSSRRHRSSISSSYSESVDQVGSYRRQRRTSYKQRSRKRSRSSYSSSTDTSDYERSHSPAYSRRSRSRSNSRHRVRSNYNTTNASNCFSNNISQPAVEERRIVYVGRIEQETTKEILKRKFLPYGNIKQVSIHYKNTGMKYGFVTYERAQDAFDAIDNSSRDSQIKMYDVSFGGRRAFCRASYADLDNAGVNAYQSYVYPKAITNQPKKEDSFEVLLMKMKAKLNANKSSENANKSSKI
uniref:RRM domain-containing protein n=1 Tax=Glossina brevipalpis TaxID=37001 RepID=A0A1A9WTS5_9MUSC